MSISDKMIKQSIKEPMSLFDYSSTEDESTLDDTFRSSEDMLLEASSQDNFTGICSMLKKCKRLEELTFSRYSLDWPSPEISQVQTEGILQAF